MEECWWGSVTCHVVGKLHATGSSKPCFSSAALQIVCVNPHKLKANWWAELVTGTQLKKSQLPRSDIWHWVKLPTSWAAIVIGLFCSLHGGLPHWNAVAFCWNWWGLDLHSHSHNPMMFESNTICPSWTRICADTRGNTLGRPCRPSKSPGTPKSRWLLHPTPWHSAPYQTSTCVICAVWATQCWRNQFWATQCMQNEHRFRHVKLTLTAWENEQSARPAVHEEGPRSGGTKKDPGAAKQVTSDIRQSRRIHVWTTKKKFVMLLNVTIICTPIFETYTINHWFTEKIHHHGHRLKRHKELLPVSFV